jgi:integrase
MTAVEQAPKAAKKLRKKTPVLDFTIKKIDALPPAAGDRDDYKDTKEQGLYLRVTRNGVKTFCYVGRAKGGRKSERLTLGKYPQVKPEQARNQAREMAGRLASGVSVATAAREKRGEMTVGELWDLYYAHIVAVKNKDTEATKGTWEWYVRDRWATKRLSEVEGSDVEKWHQALPAMIMARRAEKQAAFASRAAERRRLIAERQKIRRHGPDPKPKEEKFKPAPSKIVTGEGSANQAVSLLRAMFGFAINSTRRHFVGQNPASGIKFFRIRERERFLTPREMAPFFQALAEEPNETMRDAILTAVMTGQRRANVLAMRWSEIDFERGAWVMDGELTKNDEKHVLPLVPELLTLIERRHKSRSSVFVFPSSVAKSGHIGEPRTAWQRVLKKSGITGIIFHDLRRTLGSWLARNKESLLMIGKTLNHKTPEASAIYGRIDLDPVLAAVSEATSSMLEAAGLKESAEVVRLPTRHRRATPRRRGAR